MRMTPPRKGERAAGFTPRPSLHSETGNGRAEVRRAVLLALLGFLLTDASLGWPVVRAIWRLLCRIFRVGNMIPKSFNDV